MTKFDARLCEICGIDEAVVALSVRRGGLEVNKTYACGKCGRREEAMLGGGGLSLTRTAEFVMGMHARRSGADPEKGCPLCGSKLSDIVADGLLGCGRCYTRFRDEVVMSIRTTQGNARHRGKSPF